MIKLLSTLTLISVTLSATLAHGPQDLEKRDYPRASMQTWTAPPFVQDPQVQEWLKLVDFSKVPVYPQSENGVCPEDKTKIPKDQC
ncbi:hypothetical protein BG006_003293 [Podila minutissima]|uniref:Uncharacterized protein n=1 Tax=Podila minutissima TaxID=64525 RepID=A0A9P5VMZ1_9FUNG|nr:hypothetical protein BG006_003293 [Podila minutissima]